MLDVDDIIDSRLSDCSSVELSKMNEDEADILQLLDTWNSTDEDIIWEDDLADMGVILHEPEILDFRDDNDDITLVGITWETGREGGMDNVILDDINLDDPVMLFNNSDEYVIELCHLVDALPWVAEDEKEVAGSIILVVLFCELIIKEDWNIDLITVVSVGDFVDKDNSNEVLGSVNGEGVIHEL